MSYPVEIDAERLNSSVIEDAIYREQEITEYKGNPLIEALPPIMSVKHLRDLVEVSPEYKEEQRNHNDELRFHYIQRLFDLFQPLESHIALERKISTIIRQGYINRNPIAKESKFYMNNSYEALMEGKLPNKDTTNSTKKVQGFSIIGMSGTGKSSAIERILDRLYPEVIRHTKYKGETLSISQIPYLKLDCSDDGSTKGLCYNFFKELDYKLGTDYLVKHHRRTQDLMLALMGHLSRLHNVGVLVIDEIQHLSLQKSGGAEKILNFFVTLVNTINIPVILIGTYKSFDILNKEFRQARRGTGQGSFEWKRMENDEKWRMLMERVFAYQCKRQIIPTCNQVGI